MNLVVGVDAGGTASRAVVATVAGAVVGRGRAGPGNPLSGGPGAVANIALAVQDALTGSDPSRVVAGVVGVAGTSAVSSPAIAAAFAAAWPGLGVRGQVRIVGDVVTAFAAGTPSPSGAALIAGTGAVAARITAHEIAEVADGLGWLLGDEGSGRWMGLRALRHAVRNWSSPLAVAVAHHAGARSADELVAWAQSLPMAAIDALAPLVCAAARNGDPAARAIVTDGVARLLDTLDAVAPRPPIPAATSASPERALSTALSPEGPVPTAHSPEGPVPTAPSPEGPVPTALSPNGALPTAPSPEGAVPIALSARRAVVVLAGGLLAGDTPVRDGVLAALAARGVPTGTSRDPAAAAAWLAARPFSPLAPADLHAALLPE
ncbi:BadF/BadG/BcrA/BcrD ATPase family protein [Actinoplanes sp. CA-030573]|uniref:N-acetylglucosamine kinase n=1 Tax=Actinoplanes sp. CA-030573 TaxID=3239898 RepID=UPI003D8AAD0B